MDLCMHISFDPSMATLGLECYLCWQQRAFFHLTRLKSDMSCSTLIITLGIYSITTLKILNKLLEPNFSTS